MRAILLALILIIGFIETSAAAPKNSYKTYAQLSFWKVYSIHPEGSSLATVCNIKSRRFPVYLGYSAELGWALTIYKSGFERLLPHSNSGIAKISVNAKPLGEHSFRLYGGNAVQFIFGLDKKVLTPVFNGRHLEVRYSDKVLSFKLKGLKAAYSKALGCWRERMASVKYVGDQSASAAKSLTKQNTKQKYSKEFLQKLDALELQLTSQIYAEDFVKALQVDEFYYKAAKDTAESSFYMKIEDIVEDQLIGYINVYDLKGTRLSVKEINQAVDTRITSFMSLCQKTGIENRPSYFTKTKIEVHYKQLICQQSEENFLSGYVWSMQSDTKFAILTFLLPKNIAGQVPEGQLLNAVEIAAMALNPK